jgi:hypothetical protein
MDEEPYAEPAEHRQMREAVPAGEKIVWLKKAIENKCLNPISQPLFYLAIEIDPVTVLS